MIPISIETFCKIVNDNIINMQCMGILIFACLLFTGIISNACLYLYAYARLAIITMTLLDDQASDLARGLKALLKYWVVLTLICISDHLLTFINTSILFNISIKISLYIAFFKSENIYDTILFPIFNRCIKDYMEFSKIFHEYVSDFKRSSPNTLNKNYDIFATLKSSLNFYKQKFNNWRHTNVKFNRSQNTVDDSIGKTD